MLIKDVFAVVKAQTGVESIMKVPTKMHGDPWAPLICCETWEPSGSLLVKNAISVSFGFLSPAISNGILVWVLFLVSLGSELQVRVSFQLVKCAAEVSFFVVSNVEWRIYMGSLA